MPSFNLFRLQFQIVMTYFADDQLINANRKNIYVPIEIIKLGRMYIISKKQLTVFNRYIVIKAKEIDP